MSQTSITITDGVTTHSDVLNIINSNSSDAESRISELELVSGQGGGGGDVNSGDNVSVFVNDALYVASGDNISSLVNDSGYINDAEFNTSADENSAIYDPSGVSGDAFDFNNFHNVPDYVASGDNISLLVNDSGYINDAEFNTAADENSAVYDPSGVSGDAFDFDNFHNVPDYATSTQQNISSVSSNLTLDADIGGNAKTILTEDITGLDINNAATGENGLIVVEQDGLGPWTFSCQHPVYAGDLADVATNATGDITIGWYNDGQEFKLYVSDFVE
jgi:hypothetical protein